MLWTCLILWLPPGWLVVLAMALAYGLLSTLGHAICAVLALRAKWRAAVPSTS